jgi:GT2 family glycosyltransferase
VAVKEAKGEYVLFLNNDIEILEPKWMEELLMYAQRKDVGAVGAKLYYPTNVVQHNGIITGIGPDGIAVHSHAGESMNRVGYMGRLFFTQNVNAVTAACLLMSKAKFEEVKGFDEELGVAYNDVDLCLKLRQANYLNVVNPFATAYHYESVTRGKDSENKNKDRFQTEVEYMKKKWEKELTEADPFYNPNLSKTLPWKFGIEA